MKIYYYYFILNFLNIFKNEVLFFLIRDRGMSNLLIKIFSLFSLKFNYYYYFILKVDLFKLLNINKTLAFNFKSLVLLFINKDLLTDFNKSFFINYIVKRKNLFLFESYKLNMNLTMFFLVRDYVLNIRFFSYMEFIRYNINNIKIRKVFLKTFQPVRKN